MKKLLALLAIASAAFALTACEGGSGTTYTHDPYEPGGFVISPRGGLGVDLGGGIYLNPATGGVGVGIPI